MLIQFHAKFYADAKHDKKWVIVLEEKNLKSCMYVCMYM